jgi:predicted regulator of Ras-like GTPase activity (Roadblock/LC7/MglB family)
MEVKIMNDEVAAFALKNTLNEIQNICPDIKNAFVFREDGEIIAGDANTPEKTIVQVVDAFDGIFEKADAVNGVEGIVLEGSKGKVIVSSIDDLYLVTVTSGKADMKYVNTVTRVLIPTVLKLAEKLTPAPLKNNSPSSEANSETDLDPSVFKPKKLTEENDDKPQAKMPKEPMFKAKSEEAVPDTTGNQLIVENLGGLLVPSDTVRIDNETLTQWNELYEDRKIEEVEIETFGGKITRCKVKPIKESKYEGRGMVQMPEKVQQTLEIKKGELVRVRPFVK